MGEKYRRTKNMAYSILNYINSAMVWSRRWLVVTISVAAILLPIQVSAQHVEQKIDSLQILVGEQTTLHLCATVRKGAKVIMPTIKPSQYLVPGLEVVEVVPGDSVHMDDGSIEIRRHYVLTSFDANVYAIPALKVKIEGKEFRGNQLALKVLSVPVDTVHPNQFYPPKDVQDNPFLWSDWSLVFWLSVVVLILCFVMAYLCFRLKQNKPITIHLRTIRHIPPHEKALGKINAIKQEQSSVTAQKEYYTRLTDALREYIESRFGFNAMEMTSGEIITRLHDCGDSAMLDELKHLFRVADLVKFAKYEALLGENDANLLSAVNFIDQTKTEEKATVERKAPELSEKEIKSKSQRKIVKVLIWGVGIAILLIFSYIFYSAYQLLI